MTTQRSSERNRWPRTRRGRVIRAVCAGGLVLGVGATSTVAAWTDQTQAKGDFAASTFQVQANVSKPYDAGAAWVDADNQAAVLAFQATDLTPGATRFAPLALRTTTGSLGGTVQLQGAQVTSNGTGTADLGAALRYRVVESATCDAAAFTASGAKYLVGSSATPQPLTAGQTGGVTATLPAASASAPGTPLRLCFQVTLPNPADNALQGKTSTATWSVISTSTTT